MINFEIMEVDNDYRCYCSSEIKKFENKQEAEKYCREMSWSGLSYHIGHFWEDKT